MATTTTRKHDTAQGANGLLGRLQALLYEYESLGQFERAKPHILWLMEIAVENAEAVSRRA
jgi:hypothetical protein